jgi:hypothetical protein
MMLNTCTMYSPPIGAAKVVLRAAAPTRMGAKNFIACGEVGGKRRNDF